MTDMTLRLAGAKSSEAYKSPVRLATTENITLAGFQEIDGVTPLETDHPALRRVLVKDQTDTTENGIYEMRAAAWVRTKEFDSVADIRQGTRIYVFGGDTSSGGYVVNSPVDPKTFQVGVDPITFIAQASVDINVGALAELLVVDPNADFFTIFDTSTGDSKKIKPATAARHGADGTATAPARSYEADLDTGEYRIGANELGWSVGGAGTGKGLSASALYPITSDGLALGTSAKMFSDLYLASGAVLDWNNGDVQFVHSADTLTLIGGTLVLPASGLQVGSSNPFSDSAGTLTLQNVDALDATTESTIEAAIDTLANLTSIQSHNFTLAGDFATSGAFGLTLTLTALTNVTLPTTGTLATRAGAETLTNKTIALGSNSLSGSVSDFNTALTGADFYTTGGTDVALADGGTGASLVDPNADRFMFWDDSAGAVDWLALPAAGITISGTSLALANDLAAIEGLGSTGIAVRTASDTWAQRTLQGTANEISIANGSGASGDPTASLPSALTFTGKTVTGGTYASPASTGTDDIQQALKLSGDISPTALSGHVDDYAPTGFSTATVLRIDGGAASRNITGLAGGADGLIKIILNIGATDNLVLKNDTTSTAANRFLTGADVTLAVNQGAVLWYDSTSSRWRVIATFTTSGGGSGTVTSVATTYPISGGTISSSGTLVSKAPFNCGRLAYSSATALTFTPFMGDCIKINGTVYQIPSAGIAGLANTGVYVNGTGGQNLAGSTFYYVYAFDNGGTVTADFSTTARATSSTAGNIGTEIKSGDDTRTLIGMIRTNGSSQFVDSVTQRFVRTWFNRKPIRTSNRFSAARTTASTSYVELNSEIRNEFLNWSDETVSMMMTGPVYNGSASVYTVSAFGIDNTTPIQANGTDIIGYGYNTSTTLPSGGFTGVTSGLSEGYHYLTLLGKVSGGTGNWSDSSAGYYVTMGAVIG